MSVKKANRFDLQNNPIYYMWIIVLENCPDDHTCHVVLCMVAVVMSPQTKRCDKSVLQCSVFGLVQRPPLT